MGKKITILIISVLLIGILTGAYFYKDFLFQQTGLVESGYFEAPFFGTVQCSPAPGGRVDSGIINIPEDGKWIPGPSNVKDYDIYVKIEQPDFKLTQLFSTFQLEYYLCDAGKKNCDTPNFYRGEITEEINTDGNFIELKQNIPKGKVMYIQLQARGITKVVGIDNKAQVKLSYVPYILWIQNSMEGGLNPMMNSLDCKISSSDNSWRERIVLSTIVDNIGKSANTMQMSKDRLDPDETYNFVAGTVTRASFGNLITYKNQNGYCAENIQGLGAVVYGIGTIKTATHAYNIVDLNSPIGYEECCTNGRIILNQVCDDYQWNEIKVNKETGETDVECSLEKPCNSGRFTLEEDAKTSYEYDCINNKCKIVNVKTEECVLTEDCGVNEVCINFKCQKAATIPDEVIAIEEPSTEDACIQKATDEPLMGWTWIVISEEVGKGPLGIGALVGMNKEIDKSYCHPAYLIYYVIASVIIFLILIITILFIVIKPKKGVKKKK